MVEGLCVPFAGLHLGDLLFHFQDVALRLKGSLVQRGLLLMFVSMRSEDCYPRKLKWAQRAEDHERWARVRKTYQHRRPVKAASKALQIAACQQVDAASSPDAEAVGFEVVVRRKTLL